MPFAVARPFVEEFITDNTRNIVSYIFNYLSFQVLLMGALGWFLGDWPLSAYFYQFFKVNETANQILNAFTERLMEKDWLDDITKDRCRNKVYSTSFN